MPFQSEAQRKKLWATNPELARKWTNKYDSKPVHKNKAALERRLKKRKGGKNG